MNKIKKGDIVGRISYGKDILFIVEKVIKCSNKKKFAILKGVTERIIADSPIEDLERIEKHIVEKNIRKLEYRLENRVSKISSDRRKGIATQKRSFFKDSILKEVFYTGKILHLDGDPKYSQKSARHYKELGLNAVVKNVAENRQPFVVKSLLKKYHPDILVITGHDGMIKDQTGYSDIYNYRNSKYFINTVKEARKWDTNNQLVIFAGACQSYFEAIMSAGANFASSPARILIDFADPLIIAEKVATTENYKYITIDDVAHELRDGADGISGTGAKGKKEIKLV